MPNVYTMVCWCSSIYTVFSKVLTVLWDRECLSLLVLPYYPANNAWVIDFVVSNAKGRGNSTSVTQINLPWTGPVPFLGMQIPCTPANPVNNSAVIDVVISGFPPPLWTSVAAFAFSFIFARLRKPNPQLLGESAHLVQLTYLFLEGQVLRKVSTWLFLKQWTFCLPSFRQAPSHVLLLLDAPACSLLAPSSSLTFRLELRTIQGF